MVYYFTSNVVSPPATIYVGKDKYESMDDFATSGDGNRCLIDCLDR